MPAGWEVHAGLSEPRGDPRPRTFAPANLRTADVFRAGGRLAAAHPAYERRAGQEEMALAVEEALQGGKKLLIEAGTGVGKTFAYLVPTLLSGARAHQYGDQKPSGSTLSA